MLREYATTIGLKPAFTILDSSDAADLMNVVRHDLGYSEKQSRFPLKAQFNSVKRARMRLLLILGRSATRLEGTRGAPALSGRMLATICRIYPELRN